jgi:integrase
MNVAPKTFNRITQGYLEKGSNPVDDRIRKMAEGDGPVEIFTVDEVNRILDCATPELLPLFAIGAFAGVRTSELLLLKWSDMHFSQWV